MWEERLFCPLWACIWISYKYVTHWKVVTLQKNHVHVCFCLLGLCMTDDIKSYNFSIQLNASVADDASALPIARFLFLMYK